MSERPLSSEVRDAQKACRDLLAMADISPFGPRETVASKIHDIDLLLSRILNAISGDIPHASHR